MRVQCIQPNNLNKNFSNTFNAKKKIIYEDDYVKIPIEKYNRDKFWTYVDYTVIAIMLGHLIYTFCKQKR